MKDDILDIDIKFGLQLYRELISEGKTHVEAVREVIENYEVEVFHIKKAIFAKRCYI